MVQFLGMPGKMADVATFGGWRLPVKALANLAFSLACLGAAGVIPFFIVSEKASLGLLLMAVMPLALGCLSLTQGVRRLRETRENNCYLRAGPEGLALRLPGPLKRSSWYLAYDMWEFDFRWDEVQSLAWTPGDGRTDLVLRARGGELELDGAWFRETAAEILGNVRAAAAPSVPPIPKTTLTA
jgi:hypothetical protein